MPHVINGIGTWYYGKGRVHRLKGSCESCHRVGDLTSYDTTLYFVFVMIPVIPLSRKRILDECPACRRHRVVNLKVWEKAKHEAVRDALESLAADPHDRDALARALSVVMQFQDVELFDRVAGYCAQETDDATLQHQLGIASSYFGRREDADVAFSHALRAGDSPDVRKSAALNALRMGRPERAEKLLDYVCRDRVEDDVAFVSLVIESYMSHGRHEEALTLMDLRDAAFPDVAAEREFQKLRKQAEKYAGTGKRLNTVNLTEMNAPGAGGGNSSGSRFAKYAFPIILVSLAAAYFGYAFWEGSNQTIFLVNGTDKPYRVAVNGTEMTLPPLSPTRTRVAEGSVLVEVRDPDVPYEPVRAEVRTAFFGRPFGTPVFVINPDRTGVFCEESTTYSSTPGLNPKPVYHVGEGSYRFPEPDHVFEEFPSQIRVKGNQTVTKSRVGLERGLVPIQKIVLAVDPNRKGVPSDDVIRRLCDASPDEVLYLSMLTNGKSPDATLAFLKKRLSKRPLLVEWHRMYQTVTERSDPNADLVPEYRKLEADEPGGDTKYLLARVIPEGAESDKLLNDAGAAVPPSPYAWYALAYRSLARGEFAEAKSWAVRAVESRPTNAGFQHVLADANWALKDYDALRDAAGRSPLGVPSISLVDQYRAAVAKGDRESQKMLRDQWARLANPQSGNSEPNLIFDQIDAIINGNVESFLKSTERREMVADSADAENSLVFERAILRTKLDEAAKSLRDNPPVGDIAVFCHGLLALAARKANNAALANEQTQKMAEGLSRLGRTERRIGEMFLGQRPFEADFCLRGTFAISPKRVVLLLMAENVPERARELRALAEKLDYQNDVYSLCLKQLKTP